MPSRLTTVKVIIIETPAFARAGMDNSVRGAYIREKPHDALSKSSIAWTPKVFPLPDTVAAYIAQKSTLSYAGNHRAHKGDLQHPFAIDKILDGAKVRRNPETGKGFQEYYQVEY